MSEASNPILRYLAQQTGQTLDQILESAEADPYERIQAVQDTPELRRILALPRRPTGEGEDLIVPMTDALRTPAGSMTLRPIQALALAEIVQRGGALLPIPAGGGKTLITYLAPVCLGARRPLLIVPAALRAKTRAEFRALAVHWAGPHPAAYRVESYELLGQPQSGRQYASDGVTLLRHDWLDRTQPDLIVLDEVHKVKDQKTAVCKRVRRYLKENPHVRVVAMSGTLTANSIKDYAHVSAWCLGEASPLPRKYREVEAWAGALDNKVRGERLEPGALELLCTPDELADGLDGVRSGYSRRLFDTPGVIGVVGGRLDIPLTLRSLDVGQGDPVLERHFSTLRREWQTPDGWDLIDGMAVWRCARELALGFHYTWFDEGGFSRCLETTIKSGRLIGPTERKILSVCANTTGIASEIAKALDLTRLEGPPSYATDTRSAPKNTGHWRPSTGELATYAASGALPVEGPFYQWITTTLPGGSGAYSAAPVTERLEFWATMLRASPVLFDTLKAATVAARPPEVWMEARKQWAQWCRQVLANNRRGWDSEKQIKDAVISGVLEDGGLLASWAEVEPTFTPRTRAEWHSTEALDLAARWLQDHRGIVWTEHSAFARRLAKVAGVPYFGRQGQDDRGRSIESAAGAPCVASIRSSGTGRNLQAWNQNLIMSLPQLALTVEQLLARTHRPGQEKPVDVWIYCGCLEHAVGFDLALEGARYQKATLRSDQRLLYADTTGIVRGVDIASRPGLRWTK